MASSNGSAPRLTADRVAERALGLLTQAECRTGLALGPARVTSVRLVQPGEVYRIGPGASQSFPALWWAVEYEGTYVGCGARVSPNHRR